MVFHQTVIKVVCCHFLLNFVSSEIKIFEGNEILKPFLAEIVEEFFAKKISNVRIITTDKNSPLNKMDFGAKVFNTFELINVLNLNSSLSVPSGSNIIQVDSVDDFKLLLGELEPKKFTFSGFFLLVSRNCSIIQTDDIFKAFWLRYIYNVNILCQHGDTVSIKTFSPFQQDSCGNTTSIDLDMNSIFNLYPDKLKNLFKCPIKVATFFYPPITMRETLPSGSFRYYGSEMDLAFGLAGALNFSIDMTYINQSGFTGLLYENGTATGILKETIDGEKDMLMGFYYLTYLRTQYLSFTQSHYSIPLIIMIPPGKL